MFQFSRLNHNLDLDLPINQCVFKVFVWLTSFDRYEHMHGNEGLQNPLGCKRTYVYADLSYVTYFKNKTNIFIKQSGTFKIQNVTVTSNSLLDSHIIISNESTLVLSFCTRGYFTRVLLGYIPVPVNALTDSFRGKMYQQRPRTVRDGFVTVS